MRAFYIVGAVIVVAIIYTYFLMADQPHSSLPTSTELEAVDADSTEGSKADTLNASVAEIDAEPAHSTSPQPETTHPNSGKSIDDDWCIANTELAENDFRLAQEQKREWDLVRGDLSLVFVKANPDAPNAEYLQLFNCSRNVSGTSRLSKSRCRGTRSQKACCQYTELCEIRPDQKRPVCTAYLYDVC